MSCSEARERQLKAVQDEAAQKLAAMDRELQTAKRERSALLAAMQPVATADPGVRARPLSSTAGVGAMQPSAGAAAAVPVAVDAVSPWLAHASGVAVGRVPPMPLQ